MKLHSLIGYAILGIAACAILFIASACDVPTNQIDVTGDNNAFTITDEDVTISSNGDQNGDILTNGGCCDDAEDLTCYSKPSGTPRPCEECAADGSNCTFGATCEGEACNE